MQPCSKPTDFCVVPCTEEVPAGSYDLTSGRFQMTANQSMAVFGNAYCSKYELPHIRHPVIYERQHGRYAQNILELRAWKAQRAIEMLQVRSSSGALLAPGPITRRANKVHLDRLVQNLTVQIVGVVVLELPAWKALRAIKELQAQTVPDVSGALDVPYFPFIASCKGSNKTTQRMGLTASRLVVCAFLVRTGEIPSSFTGYVTSFGRWQGVLCQKFL